MNIVLWIVQLLLAALFAWHGWLFVAPPAELVAVMDAQLAPPLRLLIGAAELLAAAGLILPGLTRKMPALTALAAAGLMLVTAGATVFHSSRAEWGSAMFTAVLCFVVTLVAYGRWRVRPLGSQKPHISVNAGANAES